MSIGIMGKVFFFPKMSLNDSPPRMSRNQNSKMSVSSATVVLIWVNHVNINTSSLVHLCFVLIAKLTMETPR